MPIPSRILERVETFHRNLESYTGADYKEARLREEFLNPLFEKLEWDMTGHTFWVAPAALDCALRCMLDSSNASCP